MEMNFGKYYGKEVAWVVLKDPAYFYWMFTQRMTNKDEYQFAIELISRFDAMPFVNAKCNGTCRGENQVTRFSLYKGRFNLTYWFCDKCDMQSAGALAYLTEVRNISEIL